MDELETIIVERPICVMHINYDKSHQCGVFNADIKDITRKIQLFGDKTARLVHHRLDGTIYTYTIKDGLLHSFNDDPAEIEDHPTEIEWSWFTNGVIDRRTGPANIYTRGGEEYYTFYVNGVAYRLADFIYKVDISDEQKIELVLTYG